MKIYDIKNSIRSFYNGIKKDTFNRPSVLRIPKNNNSRIRQIIDYICENKQAIENYEFLILLSDEYFIKKLKIFPTKKYYIKKLSLPGKLVIEKYSEMKYNSTKYSF